jgi:uncharacterized SAM-binding protein YcdF (DUF218 family)
VRSERWRRRLCAAVLALIAAFGIATARMLVWPAQGMPAHVSAIVMFAGPGARLPLALRLAREQRAPLLVVSRGWRGYGGPCPAAPPGVQVACFEPEPGDTRGEAEFAGRLARRDHWRSLVLVSLRAQDTRARIRMQRCFGGPVYVMTVSPPWYDWPYQIAYEWGALFKAVVLQRACLPAGSLTSENAAPVMYFSLADAVLCSKWKANLRAGGPICQSPGFMDAGYRRRARWSVSRSRCC